VPLVILVLNITEPPVVQIIPLAGLEEIKGRVVTVAAVLILPQFPLFSST
jgi:hypothetical protein